MKQYITMDQLRELDNISNNILRDFFNTPFVPGDSNQQCYRLTGHEYESGICKICFNPSHEKKKSGELLLSIGQIIGFLEDSGHWTHNKSMVSLNLREDSVINICDTLWDAVKKELEK